MNISKKRLIQIIKEELEQEATPGFDVARDMEINEPQGGGATDPLLLRLIFYLLSDLTHNPSM